MKIYAYCQPIFRQTSLVNTNPTYWLSNPLVPLTTISGVCPPLNLNGTFPCCFWPLWPRPDVFPLPEAGPRPRLIRLLYAPVLSLRSERIEAKRCCWGVMKEAMNVVGDLEGRNEQLRVLETRCMGIRGGIDGDKEMARIEDWCVDGSRDWNWCFSHPRILSKNQKIEVCQVS